MEKVLNTDAIERALLARGLTQKELAQAVGTSAQAVTNWLKGKDFPRPSSLLKLATTLSLSFEQLVQANDAGRPIIAYRKKANSKTTAAHIAKATAMGMLLKPLVAHLTDLKALRTLITSPSTEHAKLQIAVAQTRVRLGIGDQAVLDYEHLIGEFNDCGALLVPVLWGDKGNHENALHIRLPEEDVTFIYLNLDTRLEDFKFWMAHELAHVLTPALCGTDEGEDFADAFAGALLCPKACAEPTYDRASRQTRKQPMLDELLRQAETHAISLNTVFRAVQGYAKATGKPLLPIEDRDIHTIRNSLRGPLVSEALFDPMPPTPERYLAACENTFRTPFFQALRNRIVEDGTGTAYVQQVLETPFQDAMALYEVLRR